MYVVNIDSMSLNTLGVTERVFKMRLRPFTPSVCFPNMNKLSKATPRILGVFTFEWQSISAPKINVSFCQIAVKQGELKIGVKN